MKNFGVTHQMKSKFYRDNVIIPTNRRKYGVDHPTQNSEIYSKILKSSFKKKEFILPSGKSIFVQGYEPIALTILLKTYNEEDIITNQKEMEKYIGKIWYVFENKHRRYYPDIYIKSQNLVIEVKSKYTYNVDLLKNKAKEKSIISKGINFKFEIIET